MFVDLHRLCIRSDSSLRQAIVSMDANECGIVLVVDEENRLLDAIRDADIRRVILAGIDLETPVGALRDWRKCSSDFLPLTAPFNSEAADLLSLMQERIVRQIPLLDNDQRVVGLVMQHDLLPGDGLPLRAVVMAGGYGHRLRPLTDQMPKVMLPIGDRPLLERILQQLRETGIREVNLAIHYKAEMISQYFGDGSKFGIVIRYVKEEEPLGTAGALSLLDAADEPLLVINGDILTRIDFRAMLDFHREHKAEMTVAVREHQVSVPYGVVDTDGVRITGIVEKPVFRHFINAGIYLLSPAACRLVPRRQRFDMTDLICRLVGEGRQVVSFPIREYWLDIGGVETYQKALDDLAKTAL